MAGLPQADSKRLGDLSMYRDRADNVFSAKPIEEHETAIDAHEKDLSPTTGCAPRRTTRR